MIVCDVIDVHNTEHEITICCFSSVCCQLVNISIWPDSVWPNCIDTMCCLIIFVNYQSKFMFGICFYFIPFGALPSVALALQGQPKLAQLDRHLSVVGPQHIVGIMHIWLQLTWVTGRPRQDGASEWASLLVKHNQGYWIPYGSNLEGKFLDLTLWCVLKIGLKVGQPFIGRPLASPLKTYKLGSHVEVDWKMSCGQPLFQVLLDI